MTSAKDYIQSVFATAKAHANGHEAEFLQAVEEFLRTCIWLYPSILMKRH